MKIFKDIIIIIFFVIGMGIPFCNRPFFVDDYYNVVMARGIVNNPLKPYDFIVDDFKSHQKAWGKNVLPDTFHPPVMQYYLAFIMKLYGNDIRILRISFLIFPIVAAISAYLIGRRFVSNPLLAAIMFIGTPVFWLNSYGLVIDMCLIAFILLGVEFFLQGEELHSTYYFVLSGIFFGIGSLVKYTGYHILIIILLWILIKKRKIFINKISVVFVFVIPILFLLLWSVWNILTYGNIHFLWALKRTHGINILSNAVLFCSFLSGINIFTLGYIIICYEKEKKYFYAFLFLLLISILFITSPQGGYSLSSGWLLAFFIINSLISFVIILKNIKLLNMFLLIWFFIGILLLIVPIPWIAGRYFLFLELPLVFITFNCIELYFPDRVIFKRIVITVISVSMVMSFMIALSDYKHAQTYRLIAQDIEKNDSVKKCSKKKIVFGDANSGFSYYLKQKGWKVLISGTEGIEKGDLILISKYAIPTYGRSIVTMKTRMIAQIVYTSLIPIRVMHIPSSAGFYGSLAGALPFSFSKLPLEIFSLYVVE